MPGVNPLAAALMGGRFEGGGTSGSWAPDPTLEERWNKTATKGLIDALMSAATLPGDVYQGKVDPYSDEAIRRSADLAMTLAGGGAATAPLRGAEQLGIFGGRLARTADTEALSRAEQMAAAGAGPADIHAATGWFKGADGQWKFEIDDSAALARQGAFDETQGVTPTTLSGAIEHPEFFAAYPEMQDMPFSILTAENAGGSMTGRGINPMLTGGIYGKVGDKPMIGVGQFNYPMTRYSQREPLKTMLHEMQHAVQEKEGFAQGSSLESARELIDKGRTTAEAAGTRVADAGEVISALKGSARFEGLKDALMGRAKDYGLSDASASQYADDSIGAWDALGRPSEEQLAKLRKDAVGSVQDWGRMTPIEAYKRSAGEVEARNVTGRMDMTAAERADIPPSYTQEVPNSQQFVQFGTSEGGAASIRAYHGSPHSFEQFSTEKIGAGEGTQMEGRGLYFGEDPAVGDFYADSTPLEEMARVATKAQGMHPDQKRQMIDHIIDIVDEEGAGALSEYEPPKGFEKAWNAVVQHVQDRGGIGGHRYEVDIAADPSQFLDWHKPLAEHPPSIQQGVLGTNAPPDPSLLRRRAEAATGAEKEFLANQADYLEGKLQMTGGQLAPRSPEEMARLRDAGIPGIKYRSDGKRRDASNYVVFDDKLISILRKYGMGGMVGTAAGYEMAQQLMQQEGEQQPPVRGINPTQPTNSRLVPLLMQQLPQTAPWSPNAT